MLTFFLTIITGFIAVSMVSSLILGIIAIRKRDKKTQEYRERVDKAMAELKRNKLL